MRKNDTWRFVPRSEIRAITREDRRRKLKQEEAQQSREPESQGTQSAAPVPAPAPRPATNVVPSSPVPVPNVQPPSQISNDVSPILVPDPVTRATFGIE